MSGRGETPGKPFRARHRLATLAATIVKYVIASSSPSIGRSTSTTLVPGRLKEQRSVLDGCHTIGMHFRTKHRLRGESNPQPPGNAGVEEERSRGGGSA